MKFDIQESITEKLEFWFCSTRRLTTDQPARSVVACQMKASKWGMVIAAMALAGGLSISGCSTTTDAQQQQMAASHQDDLSSQDVHRPSSRIEASGEEYERPFPRNSWSCTQDNVRRVGEWLDGVNTLAPDIGFPQFHPVVDGPQLESRPDVVVHLQPDWVDFNGTQLGTLDELVEAPERIYEGLEVEQERIESVAEVTDRDLTADPLSLGVVVDPEIPTARVGLFLEIITERIAYKESPLALFPGPRNPAVEPVPRELDELVEEYNMTTDPAKAQRRISEQLADQVDRCEPLIESFTELYRAIPERRQQLFRETFPSAWYDCDCMVDVELMLSTEATATFGGHPVVYAPFARGTNGDWHLVDGDQAIELERGVQWGTIVPEQIRSTTRSDRQNGD